MQKYPCHTWIYKKISSITEDELTTFIDYAISERRNRSYMLCDSKSYALKLKKIANTSFGDEMYKYHDLKEGIIRYNTAVELNNQIINQLITAKINKDFSILENKLLFERHPLFEDFIFFDMDSPFKYCGYTEALYTKATDIINFLWKNNNENIKQYISYKNSFGMTKELESYIYDMFNKHGEGNIIIEFAI